MKYLGILTFLLICITVPYSVSAQESPCGTITDSFEDVVDFYDCENPFDALIESPVSVVLEDQEVVPGSTVLIDSLQWGVFTIADESSYSISLYRKDGDDYTFVRTVPDDIYEYYEQDSLDALENKFYFLEKGLDTNWSQVLREDPESVGSNEFDYIDEFEFDYSSFAYLFESGEYVLVFIPYPDEPPVVSMRTRLWQVLVPVVYAQEVPPDIPAIFAVPFSVEVASGPLPTCSLTSTESIVERGESVVLTWNVEHATNNSLLPGVGPVSKSGELKIFLDETTEFILTASGAGGEVECAVNVVVTPASEISLHAQAAALAKELVDQPDAYLWGGKGWDYDLAEFTSPERILNGYAYFNPDARQKEIGTGLDCSGLITWAFNRSFDASGGFADNFVQYINADGMSRDYQSDVISEDELAPGDTLFFDWDSDGRMDHVAMYVGESGGYDVVDASSPFDGIVSRSKDVYKLINGFSGSRRIHQAETAMSVSAGSPVDVRIIDPDGIILTPDGIISSEEEYVREVPGELYYIEIEKGHDGNPIDRIIIPYHKAGTYTIEVIPDSAAESGDTYSLSISIGGDVVVLAEDEPIGERSTINYQVQTDGADDVLVAKRLDVDVYPLRTQNIAEKPGIVPV